MLSQKTTIFQYCTAEQSENVNRKASNISGVTILANGVYEIVYKPTFFDAFEPRGSIRILILDGDNGKPTRIECRIKDDILPTVSKTIIFTLMFLWSVGVIIIPPFTPYSLLLLVLGWIVLFICLYAMKVLNWGKLMNKVKQLTRELGATSTKGIV